VSVIIDGTSIAIALRDKIVEKVKSLKMKHNLTPGLAAVLVGDDPASEIYVRKKLKACQEVGIHSFEYRMPHDTLQKHLINKIEHLNNDPKVHGILVQLPLPKHIDEATIINVIAPNKDVDGFNVANIGKLVAGQSNGFVPCTPLGCLKLIKTITTDLTGLKVVVIGKSNIVGKPIASLLLREECTVTIVHSNTQNIMDETKTADILVTATGSPGLVKRQWVKPGAIVIDVGITRVIQPDGSYKIVGDVDFEDVKDIVGYITPVPGGVGPMTITCLLENTIRAACKSKHLNEEEFLF